MVRRFLISIAFVVVTSATADANTIRLWGVFGGYTSSGFLCDSRDSREHNPSKIDGFHLGAFAEWPGTRDLGILTQISYVRKGADLDLRMIDFENLQFYTVTERFNLHYISLAVLGKIRLADFAVSPYLVAGPHLDILVGRKKDIAIPHNLVYAGFADLVGGLTVGGGIQLHRIKSFSIFAEFRYNIDFNYSYEMLLRDPVEGFPRWKTEFINESFDFSMGIGF